MRLAFLGHAAFDLTLGGVRLCLDPHRPGAVGGRFQLPPIHGPFAAIASTHSHEDHAGWTAALGTTRFLDRDTDLGRLQVRTRAAFHDAVGGTRMGLVRMMSFSDGHTRVVHCGDLATWDDSDVEWLRGTDVLLVPAGGTYTLDGEQAAALARAVAPRWVMPMHCADPRVDLALWPVEDFLLAYGGPVCRIDVLELPKNTHDGTLLLTPP